MEAISEISDSCDRKDQWSIILGAPEINLLLKVIHIYTTEIYTQIKRKNIARIDILCS